VSNWESGKPTTDARVTEGEEPEDGRLRVKVQPRIVTAVRVWRGGVGAGGAWGTGTEPVAGSPLR
jgi:hypothetical protein